MGYWGWRPLVFAVFISVWVVGCSITTDHAPSASPTEYPPVTLTVRQPSSNTPSSTPLRAVVTTLQPSLTPEASLTPVIYVVQPGDTLLGIALHYGVDLSVLQEANSGLDPHNLQVGQPLIIPNPQHPSLPPDVTPTPLPLSLNPPTCYGTATVSLLCLGEVTNTLIEPADRITVIVQLLRVDGTLLDEHTATVEQALVLPGRSAPYRVLFTSGWQEYAGVAAVLQTAAAALQVNERLVMPVIENEDGRLVNGHYIVSATLHNTSDQTIASLRIVVTLYGADRQVVGYRVMQVDTSLPARERLPIRVEVIPQMPDSQLTYHLYVEAWRAT